MRKVGVGALRDSLEDSIGPSLGDYLRDQRRAAQLSLRQLAERAEVSNPYLSQVERGLRHPSAQVLGQIARGLRISAEALYVRAGLLDPSDGRPAEHVGEPGPDAWPGGGGAPGDDPGPPGGVAHAVRSDPHLHERHKRVLLEVYASFRREVAAPGAAAPADRIEAADPAMTSTV